MNKQRVFYTIIHMVFWCSYAVTWSYVAAYLLDCGYDSKTVGLATGIGSIISVVGQPILAYATSRIKLLNCRFNVILMKLLATLIALLVWINLPGMLTTVALFTVLLAIDAWIPSLLSTVAMEALNKRININYGLARGMGSISYAIFCLLMGYIISAIGIHNLMIVYCVLSVITVIFLIIFDKCYNAVINLDNIKNDNSKGHKHAGFLELFKKYPYLLPFLIASILVFMSHNMVNVFLLNIVERVGGDSSNLGVALFISAAVELPVMTILAKSVNRLRMEKMLLISGFFFVIKGVITYFAYNVGLIYLEQFMQFGAFAVYTPASVYFINQYMDRADSGIGQALVGACTLGMGGALGNILGGFIIDLSDLPTMMLTSAALSMVGVIFLVWCYVVVNKSRLINKYD